MNSQTGTIQIVYPKQPPLLTLTTQDGTDRVPTVAIDILMHANSVKNRSST